MKLLVKPNTTNLKNYKNADAFLFGFTEFSYLSNKNLNVQEIRQLCDKYKNKEIYIAIDKNIFNKDISKLKKTLVLLSEITISGIFFNDLSVLYLSKKFNIKIPLIWNQNFFVTNHETCNFYKNEGALGAVISSEITIDEIKKITSNLEFDFFMPVFGYQLMGFSRRSLVTNYFKYIKEENTSKINYMINGDMKCPIIETKGGTKMLSSDMLNGLLYINELKKLNIKYLILDEQLLTNKKFVKILDIYSDAINADLNYDELEKLNKDIIELENNVSDLFLNKKTIYKVKK
jgi:collagenase-like PrtC family protease